MPTTNFKAGGTFASVDDASGATWGTPENAGASDDLYANASAGASPNHTDFLRITNFGFTASDIPSGSLINGIEVSIERAETNTGSGNDRTIILRKTSGQIGDNKATATTWPSTDNTANYGGATDTWNAGLLDSDIVSADFGIDISANRASGSVSFRVDYVSIAVTYTELNIRNIYTVTNQAVMRAATR